MRQQLRGVHAQPRRQRLEPTGLGPDLLGGPAGLAHAPVADGEVVECTLRGDAGARPVEGVDVTEVRPVFGLDALQIAGLVVGTHGFFERPARGDQALGEPACRLKGEIAAPHARGGVGARVGVPVVVVGRLRDREAVPAGREIEDERVAVKDAQPLVVPADGVDREQHRIGQREPVRHPQHLHRFGFERANVPVRDRIALGQRQVDALARKSRMQHRELPQEQAAVADRKKSRRQSTEFGLQFGIDIGGGRDDDHRPCPRPGIDGIKLFSPSLSSTPPDRWRGTA
ncbi:hypothetical protein [Variovorax sp. W2I14]|uniref:hypothetical protein n=1 Tax=Variovorax sp. W2I14 TaxID=3042290 RepID=UPI003D1C8AA7